MSDLLTTEEVAILLKIGRGAVSMVAARCGWKHAPDGRRHLYRREDVEREVAVRAAWLAERREGCNSNRSCDAFTRGGAERLAQRVRDYWARRGHTVKAWVESADGDYVHSLRTSAWFVVRSDLINGWPRPVAK